MIDVSSAVPSTGGRLLLDHLFKCGVQSQAALPRLLGLSQPTVARLLRGFAQSDLVRLSSRAPEGPGNPSVDVRLNPDHAFAFGVSVMGDAFAIALLDLSGAVRGQRRQAMAQMDRVRVLAQLREFGDELLAEAGVARPRVLGAGVGISAFFSGQGGEMVGPPALEDWTGVELVPLLEQALGVPAIVENDGAVAAVAESLYGIGRDCANFVYLHLTNGFGGGIISNGRLFRGHRGNAGEFGGIWTVSGLEYPNLDSLLRYVRAAGGEVETVEQLLPDVTLATPGVDAWLAMAQEPFARLCSILAYGLDPQMIVIGGRLPTPLAEALVARLQVPRAPNRHGLSPPLPELRVASVLGDAVMLGAGLLPLQRAFFA
ncbi:ROK family protein [Xanthomonas hortorum]|uniref:ROK family protein n=1 Tax=Xanthomonas hortorum TaxID=56454 RepID=UPI001594164F|nr:ROK family protein [Xanthomonas hortorum]NHF65951.1 ROK family protein [Xanthomonas hortorum]